MEGYEIKDTGHSFRVGVGDYGLFEIFYEHERVQTPVKKEKAEEWANHFKVLLETEYPFDDLDMDEYESSGASELLKCLFGDDDEDDDCGCDDDSCEISGSRAEDLFKLMMMKKMLE